VNVDSTQARQAAVSLVLASASPRRHWLLGLLGVPFEVRVAEVGEQAQLGESPARLVGRLSRDKALAIAEHAPRTAVLGADTVVVLEGEPLGKPQDADQAADMLRRLRGHPHDVVSGVTLCPPHHGWSRTIVVRSTVWMRSYSDAEIEAYIASGDPLDKAGGYAIQNRSFRPVARLEGCYASVMGLPLCTVARLLGEIGVPLPTEVQAACRQFLLPPELENTACCCTDRAERPAKRGQAGA